MSSDENVEALKIGDNIGSNCVPLVGIESIDGTWEGDLPEILADAIGETVMEHDLPEVLEVLTKHGQLDADFVISLLEREDVRTLLMHIITMTMFRTVQRIAGELDGCTIVGTEEREQLEAAKEYYEEETRDEGITPDMPDAESYRDGSSSWNFDNL